MKSPQLFTYLFIYSASLSWSASRQLTTYDRALIFLFSLVKIEEVGGCLQEFEAPISEAKGLIKPNTTKAPNLHKLQNANFPYCIYLPITLVTLAGVVLPKMVVL